jgi:hypothetical protein
MIPEPSELPPQPTTRKCVDTSFYDLFGLTVDATSAQIRKAYYSRARSCHPDKHQGDEAKEREFKELSEAYQTLFDEERRAVYDAFGPEGLQGDGAFVDPRQVFAAVFGGPEFEPWVGVLGQSVDDELTAALDAAQQRVNDNHAQLLGLIRADAPDDEVAACRRVKASLRVVEDAAIKAVADATAEIERQNVRACVAALEARIAPFVAVALAGAEVDEAASRQLAREIFEQGITEEAHKLRRCSMGEPMLCAVGYAYVRQTQKARAMPPPLSRTSVHASSCDTASPPGARQGGDGRGAAGRVVRDGAARRAQPARGRLGRRQRGGHGELRVAAGQGREGGHARREAADCGAGC